VPNISFNCVDIATTLKLNVNKSEGPDGIHPRVLSENSEILVYPLKIIFEKSFIADDTKLFRHVTCDNDVDLLQKDLLDIQLWLEKWLLKLNIKNAKLFHMVIVLTSRMLIIYNLRDEYLFLNI